MLGSRLGLGLDASFQRPWSWPRPCVFGLGLKVKKSARRRRKHCALAVVREPNIFAPPQTPFPGARDSQKLTSWRSLPLPTDPVWWRSMHAISSYRGNRLTNTVTNPQTGPITIHCAAAS